MDLDALLDRVETSGDLPTVQGGVDWGNLSDRLSNVEDMLNKIYKLLSTDVSIDESNNDKVSIDESEDKINENELYDETNDSAEKTESEDN